MRAVSLLAIIVLPGAALAQEPAKKAQGVVTTYCVSCHQGKGASGGVDLSRPEQIALKPGMWSRAAVRVRDHSMPPKTMQGPSLEEREQLAQWIGESVKAVACADGIQPAPARLRRLNRTSMRPRFGIY